MHANHPLGQEYIENKFIWVVVRSKGPILRLRQQKEQTVEHLGNIPENWLQVTIVSR